MKIRKHTIFGGLIIYQSESVGLQCNLDNYFIVLKMERWGLDTDKFLTVTNIRMVPNKYGQAMILSLLSIGEVWEPEPFEN